LQLRSIEKESWCSADNTLEHYVERASDDSDLWTLNAAGLNLWIYSFPEAPYVKPAGLSTMRSELKPSDKIHLRSRDIEPHRHSSVDAAAAKIAEIDWTQGIFYRKERPGMPNKVTRVGTDFHVCVHGLMLAVTTPRPMEGSDTETALEALRSCL